MDFLKYCKNHFKYKFYKILLYLLIALLLLSLSNFMFILPVHATDGKLDTPSQHNWYVSSSANCYTSSGSNLTTTFVTNTYSYENISFNPYYQCNSFSSGDILAFNLGEKTSVNQLYSLTIYVGNANNAYLANTTTEIGLGNYNAQAATSLRTGTPTKPTLYSYSDSYNILTYFYQPTQSSLNETKTGTAYVIFKANTEYPFFALKLNYASAPTNIYFWGYKLTALGDTTGLTSSQVTNIVNNAVSNMASSEDITAIQEDIATSEKNIKTQIEESTNKIDNSLTSESENFEDSSCGVICKLGKIPGKIIDGLIEGLKSLFIPEDGYFETWFNDLKSFFEKKLGFLATPFTIVIDFINKYLELDSANDIIINIPNITVPNFEDHIIIEKTTLNWSDLLKSKEALNNLWQLYLAFVDIFLILNFIGLCETKYNRIFGGDTSNYEYYTVEDSISYDGQTGEVISQRQNERRTTRKKV